ncbi:phenol 2-monooxygenase [Nocardia sp. NPDC052278]|uniref:phenol 2-monooxygenase n=1 Tax=unclassified Nocardia TaxID=2637762 RepID=UPI0036C8F6DB
MQYELRYQVIEPKRNTYQNVIERLGDQPASRYLEGTLDIQPKENFHYRPTWAPDRELYDARFTALRLSDTYSFTDPRQYYYTPYVTQRAALHDEFGKSLAYLEGRNLLVRLPEAWHAMLSSAVVPLRHFESAAQLVSVAGARFADGTSLEQCCTYAAFDRIGNAQMLSRIGLELDAGNSGVLEGAKREWLAADHLQPLRRLTEEIMVVEDWAEGLLAIDLIDALVYPLLYRGLDEAALLGGAGAYSLVAQHFTTWYTDQRKWLDALTKTWLNDPEHGTANAATLAGLAERWSGRARSAVGALAEAIEAHVPTTKATEILTAITDAQWAVTAGGRA